MFSYPVPVPDAAEPVPAGMIVAVPEELLASPLKDGRALGEQDVPALAVGGTQRIRTGGRVAFVKVVAVAEAVVTRSGEVRAKGRPCDHATLGPWRTGWTRMPGRAWPAASRSARCLTRGT